MLPVEPIRAALRVLPGIRNALEWLAERGVELDILPSRITGNPLYVVQTPPGQPVYIYAGFRLRIINNRTDRRLRLIGCSVILRQRHAILGRYMLFGKRDLFEVPATEAGTDRPIECLLEPQDQPVEFEVRASGSG